MPNAVDYLIQHKLSGLKVGDEVTVTRAAKSYENGWDNTWIAAMSKYVGMTLIIADDRPSKGFSLKGSSYNFPYFVLQLKSKSFLEL